MAIKINAGEVGRGDVFFIDPQEIIVDEKLNGRWEPHDAEAVQSLVKSYETEGQLQPVQVRRVADHRVQLVMGYRRHAATVEFNKLHPDKPMKLKAVVVTINAEEAFRRNIVENRERRETTPLDDAYNQRRLRDDFGWTDTKIAEFYGVASPYILRIVSRPDDETGWVKLPIRWTVERTFAWFMKYRRLSVDREKTIESSKAMIHIAMIHRMLNRLNPKPKQPPFHYRVAS